MCYHINIEWTIIKKINIKNSICYYFHDIVKIEPFGFDNILLDEKSCENILIYDISYKTLIGAKPLRIRLDKVDAFIGVYDGNRLLVLFGGKNMILFTTGLDIMYV